jgi:hypothetical protein
MPSGLPDDTNLLFTEGQSISLTFTRDTSGTFGVLAWTIPPGAKVYDGMLITGSISEINPSNFPTDGVKYNASADWNAPADRINNAQVLGAFYNNKLTTSITVSNLNPELVYYFSAHMVSNVRTYFTQGVRSYPQSVTDEIWAGDMPKSYGPPANPTVGQVYFDEIQKLVFFWDGSAWQTTSAHTAITGSFDPVAPFTGLPTGYPALGDFFYNTQQKILKYWNGTTWVASESTAGQPMYDKPDVGTDQSYVPRSQLIDVLKKQLGYPVVCVELTEDHFNIAIDNALQEMRRRSDAPYSKTYFMADMQPFQDIYYLNEPSVGTDKVVDVLKIHRLNLLGLNFTPDSIYAQQFLNQFYAPGVGYDLISIHLISAMSEVYSQLFAGDVAFNWNEARRELRIYRTFSISEKVIIETTCEKTEQEMLKDRYMMQWLQQWAKSELLLILANIRGKYANLPGPGGGLALNADTLINQAERLQDDCLRQISDMEVGSNGTDGLYTPFVIG